MNKDYLKDLQESCEFNLVFKEDIDVYQQKDDGPVLENEYNGLRYMVMNTSGWPTAYVEIPHDFLVLKNFGYDYDNYDWLNVHGGMTYSKPVDETNDLILGWDYAHAFDYLPFAGNDDEHKWTEEEIVSECHNVINQILSKEEELKSK